MSVILTVVYRLSVQQWYSLYLIVPIMVQSVAIDVVAACCAIFCLWHHVGF